MWADASAYRHNFLILPEQGGLYDKRETWQDIRY